MRKFLLLVISCCALNALNVCYFNIAKASGPLRVHPENPRYFTDDSNKVIFLTGSHTWENLQDSGITDPPPKFDYSKYLDFLSTHNHNFFRLWVWEQAKWTNEVKVDYYIDPLPFERTGPGIANDGKLKFDLTSFNQAYFNRIRQRIIEASQHGIYVSIMLFNGWSIEIPKGHYNLNNPWRGHPFNKKNNINGINGDINNDNNGSEVHTLEVPDITVIQEAYVRKVVDTVSDLDNVLYEISNESHRNSQDWQYHMINFIKHYEVQKPKQHPVGMTVEYPGGDNSELFDSPADWISPNQSGVSSGKKKSLLLRIWDKLNRKLFGVFYNYLKNPPPASGNKVIISDTDHLCGICGDRSWVWKSFLRGLNPVLMDGYDGMALGLGAADFDPDNSNWISIRQNLGFVRSYAEKVNLANMIPRDDLASSGYCLASSTSIGAEYLIYLPTGEKVSVDLSDVPGQLSVEWFDPNTGVTKNGDIIDGGANRILLAPFKNDAVLYIYQ